MLKEVTALLVLCLALAAPEPRVQQRRGVVNKNALVSFDHPYLFLRVPPRRFGSFNLEASEEDDDYSDDDAIISDDELMDANEEEEAAKPQYTLALDANDSEEQDDDDDDFSSVETPVFKKTPTNLSDNIKPQHMMQLDDDDIESAELADAQIYSPRPNIMRNNLKLQQMMVRSGPTQAPDSLIEIEAHTAIDTKTGELSLMVPRDVFEAIPRGSFVAVMARSFDDSQARTNRVIVRRRRRNGFQANVNGLGGNRNNLRPNGNNAQRRFNPNNNNNVRIIRQNVYGRPIAQNFNRRPNAVQSNNRRRVNLG